MPKGIKCHNPYFNRWFSAILVSVCITPTGEVTILILIDGFLQFVFFSMFHQFSYTVTILILIDGFLQSNYPENQASGGKSHNPYFNRWFSAIDNFGYNSSFQD